MTQPGPAYDTIAALVEIWSEILDWDVEPSDDFFDIGGHSLLVAAIVTESRKLGLSVEARDIFLHRTVAGVAAAVDARLVGAL